MLALSGAAADGTILTVRTSLDRIRWARKRIDRGQAEAGRTDPHPIVQNVLTVPGTGSLERAAADLLPETRLDECVVSGDAAAVAAGLRARAAAGVDTVVLQPLSDETDIEGVIRFAGDEVAPLLRS